MKPIKIAKSFRRKVIGRNFNWLMLSCEHKRWIELDKQTPKTAICHWCRSKSDETKHYEEV